MKISKLKLKKLNNTRDLGGLPTEDGKTIKKGCLYRSGKLKRLPKSTKAILESFNLDVIIDLRTTAEKKPSRDTVLKGVKHLAFALPTTATENELVEKSMRILYLKEAKRINTEFDSADDYMITMYRYLVSSEYSISVLRQIMNCFLTYDRLLWHCYGGKDRTGLVAILIESLLGVSEETIIKDYLISNKFRIKKNTLNRLGLLICPYSANFKRILINMMTAKLKYVEFLLDYFKKEYGSVVEYCKKELLLTDQDIQLLKDKFLQ